MRIGQYLSRCRPHAAAALLALWFALEAAPHAGAQLLTPGELEVLQSEALLQYHSQKYDEGQATIRKIYSNTEPGSDQQVAALELLALIHRQKKEDPQAAGVYRKLLATAPLSKRPAYHFELGMIRLQQKNRGEARQNFSAAVDGNFNPGTSRFFLGLLDFEDANPRRALHDFSTASAWPDAEAIMTAVRYYLANSYLQLGRTEAAVRNYKEALRSAGAGADAGAPDPIAESATKGAAKALGDLDKSQPFSSVSLLAQWDSNVQSYPIDVTNSLGVSNQRSLKAVLSGSVAYSTSPTRDWQFTPLYSFYGNYNFNSATRDFDFLSHTLGAYVFRKPYLRFAKGFKAQSTFSMKNTPDADRPGGTRYTKYSLTHDIGPVVKYELTPRSFLTGELYWRPKKYYADTDTGTSQRSGQGLLAKATVDFISAYALWNPTGYFSFEWDATNGQDYDMTAFGMGLSNTMQLTKKVALREYLDTTFTGYNNTAPTRNDRYYSARVALTNTVNASWSWLVDASYTLNDSSVPTSFEYKRVTGSLGATYGF
ncbi:MAG: hypothetical protein HYW49_12885 [Deltaproteobacteria bacterium]|nr:hypothetical protein [Deltaproteobacteria bacterium]